MSNEGDSTIITNGRTYNYVEHYLALIFSLGWALRTALEQKVVWRVCPLKEDRSIMETSLCDGLYLWTEIKISYKQRRTSIVLREKGQRTQQNLQS